LLASPSAIIIRFELQAGHLFFQLISRRYEQGSVLISSNRPVEEWDELFGPCGDDSRLCSRRLRQPLFSGGDGGLQVYAHTDRHHARIHDHL
jgi:hypothetical protein